MKGGTSVATRSSHAKTHCEIGVRSAWAVAGEAGEAGEAGGMRVSGAWASKYATRSSDCATMRTRTGWVLCVGLGLPESPPESPREGPPPWHAAIFSGCFLKWFVCFFAKRVVVILKPKSYFSKWTGRGTERRCGRMWRRGRFGCFGRFWCSRRMPRRRSSGRESLSASTAGTRLGFLFQGRLRARAKMRIRFWGGGVDGAERACTTCGTMRSASTARRSRSPTRASRASSSRAAWRRTLPRRRTTAAGLADAGTQAVLRSFRCEGASGE